MAFKPIESVEFLVVHCSATPPSMDIGVKEIRQWHLQRGWSDVGYHYIIRRDGTEEKGREDNVPGAHAAGYNLHSLGIVLVGGVKEGTQRAENNFTPAQFETLRKRLKILSAKHPHAVTVGHRDLPGVTKACPSFDVAAKIDEWNQQEEANETNEEPIGETCDFTSRFIKEQDAP